MIDIPHRDLQTTIILINKLGLLPPATKELVFVVPFQLFGKYSSKWVELDGALMSLGLPHRDEGSELRFCIIDQLGDLGIAGGHDCLPRFMGHEGVLVDEKLIDRPRLYNVE